MRWALKHRATYFRHILAVTFTNKATQEMKDRVLAYLSDFAGKSERPRPDAASLGDELKKDLKLSDPDLRQNASELLTQILHHYDQFSISTIDAFFQRVIRAFTRESGLLGDYRLEVEQDMVLAEVVSNLIDDLKEDSELTAWVVRFAQEQMESDKSWDIRRKLTDFSKEVFRDEFKLIEEQVLSHNDPKFFTRLQDELQKIRRDFIGKVSPPAREMLAIIRSKGWSNDHFKGGKGSGIMTYLNSFAYVEAFKDLEVKVKMREEYIHSVNWPGKNYPMLRDEIRETAEREFVPRIRAINEIFAREYSRALTADLVLQNLYVFGLLSDITRKLAEYKGENNVMLLADAPKLLNQIIGDSDTPFVYEKVGSFYRNYLIDEFQDTSGFQWKNFSPLLANSLDQGDPGMVVGDVKQAIYRWRGGDLNLLQHKLEVEIGKHRIELFSLDKNFRSAKEIVQFNNLLFAQAAKLVGAAVNSGEPEIAYADVTQQEWSGPGGQVKVRFLGSSEEEPWTLQSLNMLAKDLEYLQEMGARPGEIAILVRRNEEGQEVAASLLKYKHSVEAKKDVSYEVVSNESLRIDGASSVNLLLGAMRHLSNPDDVIARAQFCYEYARLHYPERSLLEVFDHSSQVFFESMVPATFSQQRLSLRRLPLYELTETLIGLFGLGKERGELAYLQAFQDLVLEFYTRERNDLAAFLEWWDEFQDKEQTSIKLSGEVEAVSILTIHKAKGLQFKYVLIPFCSWPIDHEGFKQPNLWVTSGAPPYAAVGPMPVRYNKALTETDFAPAYNEERTRTYLDNLNLLYVALTRAEKAMIITAPSAKTRNQKSTVASWLLGAITHDDNLNGLLSEASQELVMGALTREAKKSPDRAPLQLMDYPTSRWRDQLVIRQAGNIFFEGMNPETRKRISYGVYLHAVMSRIKTLEDVEPVLRRLVQEGMMTEAERKDLEPELDDLLSNSVVSSWFRNNWDIRTEIPILLPGGASNRIDRLLLNDRRATIIDYKTGEQKKSDQQQVLEYIDILKQMGFTDVEGYLLYTRDREVVSVTPGKAKTVKKKKDDKQLGLDF